MQAEQIEKRLAWLDEQRREDSDSLSRITEKLGRIEETLASHAQQFQDLSSEVTRLAALATRIHQMDEALTKHRQEVSRQLEDFEERRSEKDRMLEDIRTADRKQVAQSLDEIRKDLSRIEAVEKTLETRREEQVRLSGAIGDLRQRMEDLEAHDDQRRSALAGFEENLKQASKRVAEVSSETLEFRKRVDSLRGDFDSLEDRLRRVEVRTSEIAAGEKERRDAQNLWEEQQKLKLIEFEKAWSEWQERFTAFEKQADDLDERMIAYEETYRSLTKLQNQLDDVLERLERRIHEVTEMQRLSEDRIKQDWGTFQAEDQKRWSTLKLTVDEQWRDHHRHHEKVEDKLQNLDDDVQEALEKLSDWAGTDQQRLKELLATLRDWAAERD
jgi:DNA repair exonuclease SbcCD ATPase subunit